ncbi:hypothetical protein EDD18DRAFT_1098532 [Armillaria luteobubalina]|uniref:Uncharacterized protein n=1 Tax=Armillaria luteobubalina TaxID=153913 RepID=A0AA39U0F7_9AGAR|nr:hypothetical protein EDD18DRAFT_1098532 [Armillaria luteobubalina]
MGPVSTPVVGSAGRHSSLACPQGKSGNLNAAPQSRNAIAGPSTREEGHPDVVHETTYPDLTLQNKIHTDGGKKNFLQNLVNTVLARCTVITGEPDFAIISLVGGVNKSISRREIGTGMGRRRVWEFMRLVAATGRSENHVSPDTEREPSPHPSASCRFLKLSGVSADEP